MQINLQPHLVGDLIELRPLRADDWEGLFAVAQDPLIWEMHPASDRYKEEVFREFFQVAMDSKGALVAIDKKTQEIIGSSRYFWYGPEQSELEIGWTFLARSHWGRIYNGEMKQLMLAHAFTFVESVVFLIGIENYRSRSAVERIGAVLTDRTDLRNGNGKMIEHLIYQFNKPARDQQ